jgi:hypothetical protein
MYAERAVTVMCLRHKSAASIPVTCFLFILIICPCLERFFQIVLLLRKFVQTPNQTKGRFFVGWQVTPNLRCNLPDMEFL